MSAAIRGSERYIRTLLSNEPDLLDRLIARGLVEFE